MRSLPRKTGKEEEVIFFPPVMGKAIRFVLPACLLLFLDRITKNFILSNYPEGGGFPVIPGIFHVTHVKNTGAAFGLMKQQQFLLIAVSLAFIFVFIFFVAKKIFSAENETEGARGSLAVVAWSLIVAGALGNLYDRIFYGYVVDFLDFRVWPVFNVADSAICIGVGLIVLETILHRKRG